MNDGWTMFCCSCGRQVSVSDVSHLPAAGWLFTDNGWTCGKPSHWQVDDHRLFYRNTYDPTREERQRNERQAAR